MDGRLANVLDLPLRDLRGRELRDLRISVTDRCNFRCQYCMPKDRFGPCYRFLERAELLDFEEIVRIARCLVAVGVRKIRLTGGEPLLRRGVAELVGQLDALGVELALTTNGSRLADLAPALRQAGLDRVTVSLDALDPERFRKITESALDVNVVLSGIEAAVAAGFPRPKINTVVRRGSNEEEILALVERFVPQGHEVRFIEFMDVGSAAGWRREEVVPAAEILRRIGDSYPLEPLDADRTNGATALRYRISGWSGAVGVIASVTQPFCQDCSRLRLTADGKLFTCLFGSEAHEIKTLLRSGVTDEELLDWVRDLWHQRQDRYSELRSLQLAPAGRPEMFYLGG